VSADTPFVVLASDGVFEFMQDQAVVDLVRTVPLLEARATA
jgi:serine/threonine protein phosphatase PrpC